MFFVYPQRFYRPIVDEFSRHGAPATLICADQTVLPSFADLADTALVSTFEATAIDWVARFGIRPVPPSRATLAALAGYEAASLVMLDRLTFGNTKISELRARYLDLVAAWSGAIDALTPEAVVFGQVPHMGFDYVLYAVAHLRGIRTVMVDRTNLPQRLFLRTTPWEVPFGDWRDDPTDAAPLADGDLEDLFNPEHARLNRYFNDADEIERYLGVRARSERVIDAVRRGPVTERREFAPGFFGQRKITQLRFEMHRQRRDQYCLHLLHRYRELCRSDLPAQPYVYFPLHFQPERSTLPGGGSLYDQLHLARMLAAALPSGWRLLVKEHPRQFRRGALADRARSLTFYDELVAVPGVDLLDIAVPVSSVMEDARAVATITGSSGWEAVVAGLPVLAFGFPWYLQAPGVDAVSSVEECAAALARIGRGGPAASREDLGAYVRLVRRKSFVGAFTDKELELPAAPPADRNAEAYFASLRDRLAPADPA